MIISTPDTFLLYSPLRTSCLPAWRKTCACLWSQSSSWSDTCESTCVLSVSIPQISATCASIALNRLTCVSFDVALRNRCRPLWIHCCFVPWGRAWKPGVPILFRTSTVMKAPLACRRLLSPWEHLCLNIPPCLLVNLSGLLRLIIRIVVFPQTILGFMFFLCAYHMSQWLFFVGSMQSEGYVCCGSLKTCKIMWCQTWTAAWCEHGFGLYFRVLDLGFLPVAPE